MHTKSLDVDTRLHLLQRIEQAHDRVTAKLRLACGPGCDTCCTTNVTMTTLEGYRIIRYLKANGSMHLVARLNKTGGGRRYRPQLTLNALAEQYHRNDIPPEEENNPAWGKCPLLEGRNCSIYAVRPFGCRVLVSTSPCDQSGFAEMDEWTLTVNQVFMQYIEHIDHDGWSGNLVDVLNALAPFAHPSVYPPQDLDADDHGLIPNAPLKVLAVAPSYQSRIQSLLKQIFAGP